MLPNKKVSDWVFNIMTTQIDAYKWIVLVKNMSDEWGLPKGVVLPDENPLQAMLRIINEQTGQKIPFVREISLRKIKEASPEELKITPEVIKTIGGEKSYNIYRSKIKSFERTVFTNHEEIKEARLFQFCVVLNTMIEDSDFEYESAKILKNLKRDLNKTMFETQVA